MQSRPGGTRYWRRSRTGETLPTDYSSLLSPKETQKALFDVKRYLEDNLCKELKLMMVGVPLVVDEESAVNDLLDCEGSRTPIAFHISNDHDKHPINAQVVQAATKWKRIALKQFEMRWEKEFVPTCALGAKTTSSTTTTAHTSTSGSGSA